MNQVEWLKPRRRVANLGATSPFFSTQPPPAPPQPSPQAFTQTFSATSGQTVTAQAAPYGSNLAVIFPLGTIAPQVQQIPGGLPVQGTLLSIPVNVSLPGSFTGATQPTTTSGLSITLDGQAHTYVFTWQVRGANNSGFINPSNPAAPTQSGPVFGTFTVSVPAWVPAAPISTVLFPNPSAPQILGPVTFTPGRAYQMTVWPIQSPTPVFPSTVLLDLGFSNVSTFGGLDGSYTAIGTFSGPRTLTTSAVTAASVLVVSNRVQTSPIGRPAAPGVQGQAFLVGETVVGLTSGAMGNVASEFDDPGATTNSVLTFSQVIGRFQPGETIQGRSSGGTAMVAYTYNVVVTSSGGMLAITALSDTTPVTAAQQGAAAQSGANQAAANAAAAGAAQQAAAAQASAAQAEAAAAQGQAANQAAAQAAATAAAQQQAAAFAANQAAIAAAAKVPSVSAAAGETATVAPPVLATAAPTATSTGTIVAVGAGVLAVGGLAWWALSKH